MARRLKNIEKVAQGMGLKVDSLSDGSGTFIVLEDRNFTINICFDGKGDKFESLEIAKKIYEVVDEELILTVKPGDKSNA